MNPSEEKQESRAVARKPRDAAAVLFVHYTSLRVANLRKPGFRVQTYWRKTEFNAKWPFKITQGHVMFWSQWKGDKGLSNTKY